MSSRTWILAAVSVLALAACGKKDDGASKTTSCKLAASKAMKCAKQLCAEGSLDDFDQKKWCGDTTPALDPRVVKCTARCSEQMTDKVTSDDCMHVLNQFDNVVEIACE